MPVSREGFLSVELKVLILAVHFWPLNFSMWFEDPRLRSFACWQELSVFIVRIIVIVMMKIIFVKGLFHHHPRIQEETLLYVI